MDQGTLKIILFLNSSLASSKHKKKTTVKNVGDVFLRQSVVNFTFLQ